VLRLLGLPLLDTLNAEAWPAVSVTLSLNADDWPKLEIVSLNKAPAGPVIVTGCEASPVSMPRKSPETLNVPDWGAVQVTITVPPFESSQRWSVGARIVAQVTVAWV
jgi:hypothetical protein